MAVSALKRRQWELLSIGDQERIVRMAWEDRTTFESIYEQFGLTANEVVRFMRTQLQGTGYDRWRRRISQRGHLKHEKNLEHRETRFKCSRQRLDGSTKGWK